VTEWSEVLIHVRRGDEFLVAHRSPESGGYWHTIAGAVEPGEAFHVAALRELHEETGLAAAELQPLGEFAYIRESWEEEPGLRVHVEALLVARAELPAQRRNFADRVVERGLLHGHGFGERGHDRRILRIPRE